MTLRQQCKNLAKSLLTYISVNGQTYLAALEIDRRIGLMLCKRPNGKIGVEWDNNVYYLGLIDAKCALLLPMSILRDIKDAKTPKEIRENFPRHESSIKEGWEECISILEEVADIRQSRVMERRFEDNIRRWRYLYACNLRNEALGKHYPGNTSSNQQIFKIAHELYPDLDLKLITDP